MPRGWALALAALCLGAAPAAAAPIATYRVEILRLDPPKLAVTADLPSVGNVLTMDTTRPGEIPELDATGWPAFIAKLAVEDGAGKAVALGGAGDAGWHMDRTVDGRLTLHYEVDYEVLARRGWPAPREAVMTDADNLVVVGRSVFITTPAVGAARVTFVLPRGWKPVTAWAAKPGAAGAYNVASAGDLVENLVVITRADSDVFEARGFRVLVASMGPWRTARSEVRRVIDGVLARFVTLMGRSGRENYLVVLLPNVMRGGESYRRSFALTVDETPSRANSAAWGNKVAHEIFHSWNGWRLRGADYSTTQWFQEGFTEYAANLAMVQGRLVDSDRFLAMLANHVKNYRELTTTLEAIGTHKGPPLYSGGALVAFSWDVLIRSGSDDHHDFGTFMRALWQVTGEGERPYAWPEIHTALERSASGDWESFYRAYVQGQQPLPLERVFALVGLRLTQTEDGAPRVEPDPDATVSSKRRWRALVEGP